MDDFVVLNTYLTRLDAEIHRSKLEAYKIKTKLTGDDEGGMAPFPFSPSSTGIRLFVLKKDYKKAKDLLR